ncbi:phosphotransferase [Halobacterium litoreum]|uniref:non-specific serine/threonine protein kinase n=1 Tax=Halobacterium litoreum TaxID=2039234 RepID=A0ABD5NIP4_9EURY|nr:phosphotransferase [Halobacterium litoreum]UHH12185.1 protein kinase family protein [Halobacterium litoreum]
MSIRRFVRGTVPWESLEAVAREVGRRYGEETVRVSFLDADNWLSTPCVVNDRWFVKVVSGQNALVHALFTSARNLGAFSSGTEGFFEPFDGPVEMAEHELEATRKLRDVGVNAPEPVEAFEVDGLGVLVLEYLPDFTPLDRLPAEEVERYAPELFEALATMHANDVAHGDLRGENVLVYEGELHFIDATNVAEDGMPSARAYDLACALSALEPLIGAQATVRAALDHYSVGDDSDVDGPADALLRAQDFLGFVQMRPDHAFDAAALNGEIGKAATAENDATR